MQHNLTLGFSNSCCVTKSAVQSDSSFFYTSTSPQNWFKPV